MQVCPTGTPVVPGQCAPYVFFGAVSSISLLLWDWALTLGEEVELLWKAKLPLPSKILFFLVRYPALLIHFSTIYFLFFGDGSTCIFYNWFRTFLGTFVLACGDVILIHHLYGFYERNKYLLWSLSIMFAAILLGVSIDVLLPGGLPFYLEHAKEAFPCGAGPWPRSISLFWISQFVFQSIAFCLIVGKYIYARLQACKNRIVAPKLYTVFMRDGLWVYLTLSVTNLLGLLYIARPGFTGMTCIYWTLTATSVCCTRMKFNLYSTVHEKEEYFSLKVISTSTQRETMSSRDV